MWTRICAIQAVVTDFASENKQAFLRRKKKHYTHFLLLWHVKLVVCGGPPRLCSASGCHAATFALNAALVIDHRQQRA